MPAGAVAVGPGGAVTGTIVVDSELGPPVCPQGFTEYVFCPHGAHTPPAVEEDPLSQGKQVDEPGFEDDPATQGVGGEIA